ncbi:hypothetical protein NDU88_011114 [Pleurodeles waltl]|uniref:Uncharacterized protein n=1 Tax=Pleurodeles waltl TaxID=8319 RepID=A0AAV7Q264_PLEWA|nr:hypothetical protein NDU88_011114 [Pleurodeles waltl]
MCFSLVKLLPRGRVSEEEGAQERVRARAIHLLQPQGSNPRPKSPRGPNPWSTGGRIQQESEGRDVPPSSIWTTKHPSPPIPHSGGREGHRSVDSGRHQNRGDRIALEGALEVPTGRGASFLH